MACPFLGGRVAFQGGHDAEDEGEEEGMRGELGDGGRRPSNGIIGPNESTLANNVNKVVVFSDQISYSGYLQLEKLLDCQELRSREGKQIVPDEHLFIVIHQTYELWFKQIIYDIDQVRYLLHNKIVDETKTLQIVSLLERTAKILKLLVDQILILETMSPLDFVEFRRYLTSASGFQSLQFRLLENKLGVLPKNRVSYNYQHYREVFPNANDRQLLIQSEKEPSLFVLIDRWLSRTPGIYEEEFNEEPEIIVEKWKSISDLEELPLTQEEGEMGEDKQKLAIKRRNLSGKTFWNRYLEAVAQYLEDMRMQAEEPNQTKREKELREEEFLKFKRSFDTITSEESYNAFVHIGQRRLSHNALKGALMIYFYRDMPRFSQPYQILFYLMDIDSLLQKWRYNHLMLVQRMLGSKMGSGGSSGYMYLRSTVSDRYKVFLDLFNLSTWLIPRNYIPKLSPKMMKTLSGTQI